MILLQFSMPVKGILMLLGFQTSCNLWLFVSFGHMRSHFLSLIFVLWSDSLLKKKIKIIF